MRPSSPWSAETEGTLLQLYNEGKAYSSISGALREMGYSISRSAVSGKINRMDLPPRTKQALPQKPKRPTIVVTRSLDRKAPMVRSRPLWTTPLPSKSEPDAVPFLEIRDGQCKAILAYQDGQLSKAMCCGRKTRRVVIRGKVRAKSWCDEHEAIYTQEDR